MGYNFVIFGLSPWNIQYGCNIRDISLELAKHHNVLYIDVPLKRKERWFMKQKPLVQEAWTRIKSGKLLFKESETLWHYIPDTMLESVNQFKNNFLFDIINGINNRRFARSIRKAVREVGFLEYILLNDNDIYNGLSLTKILKPSLSVYYLRDMLSAFKYWKGQVSRLEPALIQRVDLVVTNSAYLAGYARKFNPHSYDVGQGCDITPFIQEPDKKKTGEIFKDIPGPVIGYVGALNSERLDIELIQKVAEQMPDFSFVLVGPEDNAFHESALHRQKNVYFLGKQDVSDLPDYIFGFDVCMNPQALNEITVGNYPRKVDEYLAAGKPVVATTTEAMQPFREHVYLGRDAGEYVKLIKLALDENNAERASARSEFASEHSWRNSTNAILNAIDKTIVAKK